ncbi:MAG: S9 family peptidase [Saprospiraceae bacterium]|nr:S9 family peptidase [Saprospiraceae bacterium]
MRIFILVIGFAYSLFFSACRQKEPQKAENITPPAARIATKYFEEHGHRRADDYFWVSDPKDSTVLNLLDAENAYTDKVLSHTLRLQNKLFDEIKNRQELQKSGLPIKRNGYWYYRRFEKNGAYPLVCRKKNTWTTDEEIVLNVPELAKKYNHFELADVQVSPDNGYIAYLVDTTGERRHLLFIKNLQTGSILSEIIPNTASEALEWSADSKSLYYVLVDETVRGNKVMRHNLGMPTASDKLIFEEKDNAFVLALKKSRSQRFIFIGAYSNSSYEFQYFDASKIDDAPKMIQKRQSNLIYDVNHFEGETFFIQNNQKAKNFKLSTAPLSNPSMSGWKDIVPHSDSSLMENFEVLKDYILIQDKAKGLNKIRILNRNDKSWQEIDLGDEAYVAEMSIADYDNFALDSIRYNYQSLSTPPSVFIYDLKSKTKTILQQADVNGYNISKYESKRIWIKSRDSVLIPLSIVYRKDLFLNDGSNPLVLYGYGSYGISVEPKFQSDLISLLDRGFVYCIAHVRGGQEMGRKWYEDGKLMKKKNSFNDYIDCAEYLVSQRFTSNDRLFGMGSSAGGMLVAASINMRPDLFKGVVVELPWTDVVSDMLNESLPLTTLEYGEWGNPKQKEAYEYMLSWSPYDNVKSSQYPAVLAFANLYDSQVPFYSPTKWVLKLRANNTSKNPILLQCNKAAQISSGTDRFEQNRVTAKQFAFMLNLLGRNE